MATGTGRLRRSPGQNGVLFAQGRIVVINHDDRAMITGIGARIERTETEDAFFDREIAVTFFPGDERLAIAAINPGSFEREIVAQDMLFRTFAADDRTAGARHGEVGLMPETMNFQYVG